MFKKTLILNPLINQLTQRVQIRQHMFVLTWLTEKVVIRKSIDVNDINMLTNNWLLSRMFHFNLNVFASNFKRLSRS